MSLRVLLEKSQNRHYYFATIKSRRLTKHQRELTKKKSLIKVYSQIHSMQIDSRNTDYHNSITHANFIAKRNPFAIKQVVKSKNAKSLSNILRFH